jgi:L-lactate dehydrogenase (cytochrome)
MVSTNASCSLEEMSAARLSENQVQFFQFYKHRDDNVAEALLRRAEGLGYKAIFLTVDAIVAGNRERDIRSPWVEEERERVTREEELAKTGGRGSSAGVGLADAVERKSGEEDVYEDAKEEVGGMAGALLKTSDLNMSWEKVGRLVDVPLVLLWIVMNGDYRPFLTLGRQANFPS